MNIIAILKSILIALFSFVAVMLGGFDSLIIALFIMMLFDYTLGIAKGVKTKTLSSSISFWGIFNKYVMGCLIIVATQIGLVVDMTSIRFISIIWLMVNEGISIAENIDFLCPSLLPKGLSNILVQSRTNFSINISKVIKRMLEDYIGSTPNNDDIEIKDDTIK